ncbi:MAG: hypothetical protein M3Y75_13885 [Actinomycetota bacterium]|nr:hypothetical protein [Actinomycetota bacterium]
MLFDLRGRRRNVIKVVYAVLAILMGASLFLTVGPFSIAEIFNDGGASTNTAEPYEEEAERIEAKLKKEPQNSELLLRLTRAQINAGNNLVDIEDNGNRVITPEATQEYLQAYQSWSDYLEATKDPDPGLALLVAPMMIQLTEFSRTYPEFDLRLQTAIDAQRIVAEKQPSVNAWTTLAFYTYFTGDSEAADKAKTEAKKLATNKAEAKAIDTQLKPLEKSAEKFLKEKAQAEKAEEAENAAGGGGGAARESLENPFGGLGGGGLSE